MSTQSNLLLQDAQGKKKGQKGQKKKNVKNKNSQRKANNKKSNLPVGGNDLSAKLYSTMEKHKEVSNIVLAPRLFFFFMLSSAETKIYPAHKC